MMGMRYYTRTPTHEFIVLDIEEDELGPEVCPLCSLDDLGDVDAGDKQLEVLHN